MKKIFKSLFGKIALIFLVEIMVLSAIQMYLSLTCTFDYYYEKDQRIHACTAPNLVDIVEKKIAQGATVQELQENVENLRLLNPNAHIFLLDHQGNILQSLTKESVLKRQKVSIHPILEFLSYNRPEKMGAIFIEDPLAEDKQVIFSASPINLPGKMGYLLVTFNVPLNTFSWQSIKESGVLQNTSAAAMLTVLLSLLAGFLVFFFLNRRLQIMRNVVNYFKNGKYDARIPVKTQDEIGELGVAFNNMANAFEQYLQNLKNNDRMRRELIANISHDLRSPLASARGYIETILMKDQNLNPEDRKKFLEIIHKNIVHLNELVDDLFELAKYDAKQIEPTMEPFSIAELLQDIVLKFQPQAEAQKITLISRFQKNLPLVMGDIGMIERAVSNLIQNALKFCGKGCAVILEVQKNTDHVCIKVKDNGPGIPEKDLPHIFDRFYRVDKSRNRAFGGSGLGLAIVKKIIEAHHSTIEVVSSPEQGTVFSFVLPFWQQNKRTRQVQNQKNNKLS